MSAGVDVLAVMTVSERLLANSDFHGAVAYVNRVTEARAAVAELMDKAHAILSHNPAHYDTDEEKQLRAALAKCGGGE